MQTAPISPGLPGAAFGGDTLAPVPGGQGAPRGALGCLAESHCTSSPLLAADAPPARSTPHAAKPGCRLPRRVGGSAGTPPAPITKPPIHGEPTLARGDDAAMGSHRGLGPTLSPPPQAPQAHDIGTHPGVGGKGTHGCPWGGNIKPRLPLGLAPAKGRTRLCPLAACSSLPAHQWYLSHPWVQGSSVGWGAPDGGAGVAAGAGGCCATGWAPALAELGEGGRWMLCPDRGVMPWCPLAWALRWSWAAVGVLALRGGCKPRAVQGQWVRSDCGMGGCIGLPLTPWGVRWGFGVPVSWLHPRESREVCEGSGSARGLAEERGLPAWGPPVSALPGQVGALPALPPAQAPLGLSPSPGGQ